MHMDMDMDMDMDMETGICMDMSRRIVPLDGLFALASHPRGVLEQDPARQQRILATVEQFVAALPERQRA